MNGKPHGIAIGIGDRGPTLSVTRSTCAQDLIWDAVGAAQEEGMTPSQFKRDAAEAWNEKRKEQMKDEAKEWGAY